MHLAWLIPTLSAAAFVIVALGGRWLPTRGAFVSIAAMAAGFALSLYALADLQGSGASYAAYSVEWLQAGNTTIGWGVHIDRLAVVMLALVTFVALLVQVYSLEYMRGDARFGWYFAVHSLFGAAMLALVLADNLLFLYIAWELVGLGSYLLIGHWWERRSAAEAAKKAFITTRIGDVGLLIGIILLFRATGTFSISDIIEMRRRRAQSDRPRSPHPRCCCSWARWASPRSSPSMSGCPTRWKDQRPSARSFTPPRWSPPACIWWRACCPCSSLRPLRCSLSPSSA